MAGSTDAATFGSPDSAKRIDGSFVFLIHPVKVPTKQPGGQGTPLRGIVPRGTVWPVRALFRFAFCG